MNKKEQFIFEQIITNTYQAALATRVEGIIGKIGFLDIPKLIKKAMIKNYFLNPLR